MRVQIVGVERAEGTSTKNGKPYAMGSLHAIIKLEERSGDKQSSKGYMGASYRVDPELVKKLEHNSFPLSCELVIEDVMRFGKRETNVLECRPVERAPSKAAA